MNTKKVKVPFTVWVLGIVSLFNDTASEMIYPIVPIFLSSVLHAPIEIIGTIEGIAEATASLMKFVSGYISDKLQKRKRFVVGGYGLSAVSKALIAVATVWPFVLFARIIDRLGKGVRTSARDAILLQNSTPKNKGFIFGFHRSLDSAGAVVGPLLALILLNVFKENMRLTFLVACIPAVIGVILLVLFVKEKKSEVPVSEQRAIQKSTFVLSRWKNISPRLKLFFVASMLFSFGNSSDIFIILRGKQLGLTTTLVVLAYVLYNVVQTLASTPAGSLSDKIGAKRVFSIGLLIFALVYGGFALMTSSFWLWILFPIYGAYIAFTDGVSKAYISEFITEGESGTFFGLYQTGLAVCGFFASFIGGIVWSSFGPAYTFLFGSAMALLAFVVLKFNK